ncbi:MAG: hypothetical protein D6690_11080 [Nitrospirae bacterium]|nr:MAG: hypothetical protein D6690_11080 [Nitrospirota bacterium]
MVTRRKSVEALIKKCKEAMVDLKRDYEASLQAKEVSEELKVDIKNVLENLRSCLDYVARDVHEKYVDGDPGRLYFPIRSSVKDFEQAMAKNYGGVKTTAPGIYAVFEKVQPFNDPWLGTFNRLNNDNKHENLVEQTRTETRRVTVSSKGGGGSVSWGSGVTFGSGVSVMGVPIDPRTQMPVPNSIVETRVEIWVDFKFAENNESVIPFLERSIGRVEQLCDDIYKEL